jgi:ABC-type antimicrobial peptide transport system permease subunit
MLGLIFGVVALLGFIISWLLISGRKREFAVMRGFGVKRGQLFLSFFWEQALLCVLGCAVGCLAMIRLHAGGALQWLVLGGYVLCYLAGCAVSVKLIGKMNLMELLSTRE